MSRLSKELRNIQYLGQIYRKLSVEAKIALINILIEPDDEGEMDARLDHELRGFIFASSYTWYSSSTRKKREALKKFIAEYVPGFPEQTEHKG